MKKRINYTLPLLLGMVTILGMFIGAKFSDSYKLNDENTDPKKKIEEVIRLIENSYVDDPDGELISEAAIEAMLQELDPHSVYIPARDLKASNEELEGNFEGIGVEFNILSDTIIVVSALSGGPSEQLGIRPGDRIIKIDGKDAVGFKNEDVIKNLRGAKGTQVKVTIKRPGAKDLLQFNITRDKIPIYSVDASYMAAPGIGYIKINRFGATTMDEYRQALRNLQGKGMKNLILDLRGNPGGYLDQAIRLSDEFLPRGERIVYTEGRSRSKKVYDATSIGDFEDGKLAILIDEGSASASEIVSGAVQDHDRGIIIGRRSFGKGLVQEPFLLTDGSALRLTVARYYTPAGRSIQRSYEEGAEAYYGELNERFESGELLSKDSIHFDDSVKYYTDNKRVVFGGGGVMPDIYIAIDTSENSPYLQQLFTKGIFNDYVLQYLDHNRKNLESRYKTFEDFNKGFEVDQNMLNDLTQFAAKNGVSKETEGFQKSKEFIRTQTKALVARHLFRNDGYFQVINSQNDMVQKAIEVLQDNTFNELKLDNR